MPSLIFNIASRAQWLACKTLATEVTLFFPSCSFFLLALGIFDLMHTSMSRRYSVRLVLIIKNAYWFVEEYISIAEGRTRRREVSFVPCGVNHRYNPLFFPISPLRLYTLHGYQLEDVYRMSLGWKVNNADGSPGLSWRSKV